MTRQKNTQNGSNQVGEKFPIKQQPIYSDLKKLAKIEAKLSSYPALIYFDEAIKLKKTTSKCS